LTAEVVVLLREKEEFIRVLSYFPGEPPNFFYLLPGEIKQALSAAAYPDEVTAIYHQGYNVVKLLGEAAVDKRVAELQSLLKTLLSVGLTTVGNFLVNGFTVRSDEVNELKLPLFVPHHGRAAQVGEELLKQPPDLFGSKKSFKGF
jgi:hypothetical protein